MSETCPKCKGYLYAGWHTTLYRGREIDEAICLMTGPLREELQSMTAERDGWKSRLKLVIDEVCKHSDGLSTCEANECGGCESDDSLPCEELCRNLAHQLEHKEADKLYDMTAERDAAIAKCVELENKLCDQHNAHLQAASVTEQKLEQANAVIDKVFPIFGPMVGDVQLPTMPGFTLRVRRDVKAMAEQWAIAETAIREYKGLSGTGNAAAEAAKSSTNRP